jgi:hypothetical protein
LSTTEPRQELRPFSAAAPTRAPRELPRPRPAQRAFLQGSARAVLQRLAEGDPLRLRARIVRRLTARHLLMDAEAVLRRTLVHAARDARDLHEAVVLEDWLGERIDRAVSELLSAQPECESSLALWRELARPLGLDPRAMARASVRFNARPPEARRAFFQLVLGGASLEECARRGGVTPVELAQAARSSLQVFLDELHAASCSVAGGEA